ncbi:quaternary amine ABC transporter ATP-binding protein [Pontibaca methylaminivorans]|uniref:quaternary amine ABC transporter ATP-binding protein n=1 Tax=Pontibaca methylaminivorans TaxID=515897 RepID=UPI002FD9BEE0
MNTEMTDTDILIDCEGLWKVFGARCDEAIRAVTERQLGKAQILQEFGCVVGVSDASFRIHRGEIFCVMGLSGSGKSTLIRLLNRLIEPSLGRVLVKGRDLAQMDAATLRATRARDIGMVFQSVALLPQRTVLENAAFGLEVQGVPRDKRNAAAQKTLEMVGLGDWGRRYPAELSGGMQQRVGLARALTADPEIILMDEPFSALDPLIRRQLQDEFRGLIKTLGKSSVFITHDLDEAIRLGDRIAIMKDGAIIQIGTAEEIVLNPADQYVADFVAGISRLHLVKAHSVMTPVAEFRRETPGLGIEALPKVPREADIDTMIGAVTASDQDAVAVTDSDTVVGVATIRDLLVSMRGDTPATAGGPQSAADGG